MVIQSKKTMLKKLIGPLSIQCFLDNYYQKDFYCIRNREKDYYKNILTIQDINDLLLLNRLPAKNVRMAETLAYEQYLSKDKNKDLHLDFSKIKKLVLEGYSFILNDLDLFLPKLNLFSKKLGNELFARIWTNVYITPPNSQAFPRHFDTHDTFILQIRGSKKWRLFGTPLPLPEGTQTFRKVGIDLSENPRETIELLEGDCLYVPRGVVHQVNTTEELSIHITVGIHSPQVHELLGHLRKDMIKELFFRKNLFDIDKGLSQEVEKEFKEQLIKIIKTSSIEDLMQSVKAKFSKDYLSFGHDKFLNNLISEMEVDSDTIIIKKANYSYETSSDDHFYVLKVNGKKQKFSFFMKPIITQILNSEKGVVIKELKGERSEKSKIKLVKRLLSKGIFETVASKIKLEMMTS